LRFADTIAAYMKLTEIEQLEAEARRLEKNGMTNSILLDRFHNLRSRIDVYHQNELINKQNKVGETFNEAVTEYNDGINLLNDFIDYRNKQFQPARTDAQIQGMVDAVDKKIVGAQAKLKKIKGQYDKIDPMISSLEKSMSSVEKSLGEQKDFLTEYFGKNKLGRKMMFRKYTINGIPLN
jgi:capsule polysaccharide export protein KpsE/RkpR